MVGVNLTRVGLQEKLLVMHERLTKKYFVHTLAVLLEVAEDCV